MSADLTAVTTLYDLGRGSVGRPIEEYIQWLNATLRLPVPFTIFLDPGIERSLIKSKPADRICHVPIEEWQPMGWEPRVDEIRRASRSDDLTFTLPRYSLLVMSKFDMMRRVARENGSDCKLLWIDAGLSRFFRQDMAEGQLSDKHLGKLRNAAFAASINAWALKQIHNGQADNLVGTATRLVTGGDLYATGTGATDAAHRMYQMVEQKWLPQGKWDNEQVAMGCLLADHWPGFETTRVTSAFGSLVADLFSLRLHRRGLPGRVERWFDRFSGR